MRFHRLSRSAAALAAAVIAGAPSASADQPARSVDGTLPESESSRTVDALVLGYRLADYARSTQDARAMIVAARIVDSIPAKPGIVQGKLDGPAGAAGAAPPKAATGEDLFAEARTLAAGDPVLMAEIESAQAEASRGCLCGGAIRTTQFVPANTTWTVRFAWRGGEPMVVGVRRDADVPVDLKLYDENGNLICQDMSHKVTLYCRVNPIWSGPITVQAINHGEQGTGVVMVTN